MTVSLIARPGSRFIRTAAALAVGDNRQGAVDFAREAWPDTPEIAGHLARLQLKDATASTTGNAPALLAPGAAEFVNLVRAREVLGKLARRRRVPFHTGVALATGGAAFGWVGQGRAYPVGRHEWDQASLPNAKCGGIVVLSRELLRLQAPAAEDVVREELISGITEFSDAAFLDPSIAEVPNENPASITNGVAVIPASGTDAAAARADMIALIDAIADALGTLDGVYLIMADKIAFALSTLLSPAGTPVFPELGVQGGAIFGVPAVVSSAAGDQIVAVHAPSILVADDGAIEIAIARDATVQMAAAPTQEGNTPTESAVVSLWQNNLVGLRVTRWVNWQKSRADAVHVLGGVEYAGAES